MWTQKSNSRYNDIEMRIRKCFGLYLSRCVLIFGDRFGIFSFENVNKFEFQFTRTWCKSALFQMKSSFSLKINDLILLFQLKPYSWNFHYASTIVINWIFLKWSDMCTHLCINCLSHKNILIFSKNSQSIELHSHPNTKICI